MDETILAGRGHHIMEIPDVRWKERLSQASHHSDERLGFMSAEHQRVRYFVVQELARLGRPLEPRYISQEVGLPLQQVLTILDDLEQHLTFLVRDGAGAVAWAYPVTVEQTPHRLAFRNGERLYAA